MTISSYRRRFRSLSQRCKPSRPVSRDPDRIRSQRRPFGVPILDLHESNSRWQTSSATNRSLPPTRKCRRMTMKSPHRIPRKAQPRRPTSGWSESARPAGIFARRITASVVGATTNGPSITGGWSTLTISRAGIHLEAGGHRRTMSGGATAIFRVTPSKLPESISGSLVALRRKMTGVDRVVRRSTVC